MNQNLTEFDELIVSRLISCTQSSRADILAFLDPFIVIDQREEWVSTITIKELQEPDLEVVNKAKEADWEYTIMLRNLPNRLGDKDVKLLLKDYLPYINFLYLRMDFKSNCNVGYCFVNFTSVKMYQEFEREFVGKRVGKKFLKISVGQIQGLRSLIKKFKNSPIMLERQEFRPQILKNGVVQEFPKPNDGVYRPKVDVLYSRIE